MILLHLGYSGYTKVWLRGEETPGGGAHVHEGLRLTGRDGWVAVGHTLAAKRKRVATVDH